MTSQRRVKRTKKQKECEAQGRREQAKAAWSSWRRSHFCRNTMSRVILQRRPPKEGQGQRQGQRTGGSRQNRDMSGRGPQTEEPNRPRAGRRRKHPEITEMEPRSLDGTVGWNRRTGPREGSDFSRRGRNRSEAVFKKSQWRNERKAEPGRANGYRRPAGPKTNGVFSPEEQKQRLLAHHLPAELELRSGRMRMRTRTKKRHFRLVRGGLAGSSANARLPLTMKSLRVLLVLVAGTQWCVVGVPNWGRVGRINNLTSAGLMPFCF